MLRIGHLSTIYHTHYILMNNTGFNNDLKNDIFWRLFGTGPEMVQAFKNDELDIGYMGLPPAIIGIDSNVPIRCIAGGHVEGTIMVSKKEYKHLSELNNNIQKVLSQFIGKSLGVPSRGSIHDVILNYYLDKTNLLDAIKVKNYKHAEFIALDMKKGILEGGVGTPSLAIFASTILDSHIIIPAENFWEFNPSYGLFTHEELIKNKPELILKFLSQHKEASRILRNNPLRASELIARNLRVADVSYINSTLKISPKYCIALPKEYIESTMGFVKILHNLNYIEKELRIEEIFNFDFIRKIHPEASHY